ncbi:regulatory protein RecX [Paraurantiacibacter namhicola]|uniref:Recombination regulator RecX n=1 Tax=Paraurantiacibacter namhicola TaxID=645517 RepID=A0A1C7D6K8_9SPHN|nr:RecX family transcriptional regulator [Paraurantiacibacter namhicola]ANU07099.1 recombination regulator RecX [Paraurantiacibacter namhicola]
MVSEKTGPGRRKRPPKPLDEAKLRDLALHYVARFATSSAKLERYLTRKLRERGWGGERDPDVPALVASHVEAGYIDDDAYARMRAGSLTSRGYGARRVAQVLHADGLAEDVRAAHAPDERAQREAILRYAKRRRFGPFAADPAAAASDRALREKQLAAMVRAGHSFDHARAALDARSETALEEWVGEYEC